MERRELGFEMNGFKLGGKFLYKGKETTVLGFDSTGVIDKIFIDCEPNNSVGIGTSWLISNEKFIVKDRINGRWVDGSELTKIQFAQFTKSDLKSGDTVVFRNGSKRFVLVETATLHDENGSRMSSLTNYFNNLRLFIGVKNDLDIMRVYHDNQLIWEREEKTSNQVEIDKLKSRIRQIDLERDELKNQIEELNQLS